MNKKILAVWAAVVIVIALGGWLGWLGLTAGKSWR